MDNTMPSYNVSNARQDLFHLVDEVNAEHRPVQIRSRRGNAVMVSEEDWRAIQETLYLVSMPGMRESLLALANAPDSEFVNEEDVDL